MPYLITCEHMLKILKVYRSDNNEWMKKVKQIHKFYIVAINFAAKSLDKLLYDLEYLSKLQ